MEKKIVKAINVDFANWFENKNQWLVKISTYSTCFAEKTQETEKAMQIRFFDTQTKKEYFVWTPKSAMLNPAIFN